MKGDTEYAVLIEAMDLFRPRCRGDERFTADVVTPAEVDSMKRQCKVCSCRSACDAFARAAEVNFGVWAGTRYGRNVVGKNVA